MLSSDESPAIASIVGTQTSADHTAALAEAQRLASFLGRSAGSADLLLALLRVGGSAARILFERGITPSGLEGKLASTRPEGSGSLRQIDISSRAIAHSLGAPRATSLHLLLAILRSGGAGMDLLRLAGHEPIRVRTVVMRALTGPGRFAERTSRRDEPSGDLTPQPVCVPPPAQTVAATAAAATTVRTTRTTATQSRAPAPSPRPAQEIALELVQVMAPAHAIVNRERELGRALDLLRAGGGRIVCIAGEPGSGRSALASALAGRSPEIIATPTAGPSPATGGTPGSWLAALHEATPPEVPILIDGCGALGSEHSDGPTQLVATARAGRRWILIATTADLRRFDIWAPDLSINLEIVTLAPLAGDALEDAIAHGLLAVGDAHGADFDDDIVRQLVRLSPRYPTDRAQPGRALAIAEVAAARATRLEKGRVSAREVAEVVADASGTPIDQLLRTDDERFRNLEDRLAARVVGHEEARARIADVLRRAHAGFRGRRPLGSMLLLGPTGVGKTETARAIAEALFDDESAMVRIDLSEYNEAHAVARLIGSPPGYVGHEDGGQLTEAVRRRPATVLLFDEFEKANREVLLLLLQVLEDGRLTDGRGRTVDFSSTTVVMTSNLGSELYKRSRTPPQTTVLALARTRLPAELWNRIDEVLCYAPLSDDDLRRIVARIALDSSARLEHERGISYNVDEHVVDRVLAEDSDRSLGARPLRRAFE
ncbi:MAG: AAA family ATPase, partial [Deltaproteobacteria bacterium]|nr:AAA family ATPase [Deltaproteobacteria bacterium]